MCKASISRSCLIVLFESMLGGGALRARVVLVPLGKEGRGTFPRNDGVNKKDSKQQRASV